MNVPIYTFSVIAFTYMLCNKKKIINSSWSIRAMDLKFKEIIFALLTLKRSFSFWIYIFIAEQ